MPLLSLAPSTCRHPVHFNRNLISAVTILQVDIYSFEPLPLDIPRPLNPHVRRWATFVRVGAGGIINPRMSRRN